MVGGYGKAVAALVFGVACMALDPVKGYAMPGVNAVEAHPEVYVFLALEAGSFPLVQPALVEGLHDIGGVAHHVDFGVIPLDLFQADDDGHELHAVVGGAGETARKLFLVGATAKHDAVPSGTGIAAGGTVRKKVYGWLLVHVSNVLMHKDSKKLPSMKFLINGKYSVHLRNCEEPNYIYIMKKILVILALSLVALSAKAQVYVGGGVSFAGSGNAAVFSIAPEAGYCFDDDMAAGLSLGLGFGKGATALAIDPYFRYFFAELGPVRFFGDAHFNFTHTMAGDATSSTWGIGVRPGIAVNITDNWSLVAHVARLGYYEGAFGFYLNTGSTIGVYYAF